MQFGVNYYERIIPNYFFSWKLYSIEKSACLNYKDVENIKKLDAEDRENIIPI